MNRYRISDKLYKEGRVFHEIDVKEEEIGYIRHIFLKYRKRYYQIQFSVEYDLWNKIYEYDYDEDMVEDLVKYSPEWYDYHDFIIASLRTRTKGKLELLEGMEKEDIADKFLPNKSEYDMAERFVFIRDFDEIMKKLAETKKEKA